MGWLTAEDCLAGGRLHLFSEGWELRERLRARDVELPAVVVHAGLSTYMRMMGMMADPQAAETVRNLAAVWEIDGAGGGTWTVRLRDGRASVAEERDAQPDVVVRTSVDAWMATFKKTANPMLLMLTGKMRVKGMRRFAAFGKVFKEPPLDRRLSAQGNRDFFVG
jgi:putative sterol carrier protein